DANSAIGAKAKFANDYNSGRYRAVIDDAQLLRKFGALDAESLQVIAQAYYKSGDLEGCVRYIRNNLGSGAGQTALELERRCAYGCAGEAKNVIGKGTAARVQGVAGNEFFTRLMNTASATAAKDAANLATAVSTAKNGDALVKLGESQWGGGKPQDTVKLVQMG